MRVFWGLFVLATLGGLHAAVGWYRGEGGDDPGTSRRAAAVDPATLSPNDPRRITGDTRIVMIAAEWCGYCRKQQKDFEQAGVRYRVLDYDQPEGKLASQALGTRGVPITVIGQNVVAGYRTGELDDHLTPLGYDVY